MLILNYSFIPCDFKAPDPTSRFSTGMFVVYNNDLKNDHLPHVKNSPTKDSPVQFATWKSTRPRLEKQPSIGKATKGCASGYFAHF